MMVEDANVIQHLCALDESILFETKRVAAKVV